MKKRQRIDNSEGWHLYFIFTFYSLSVFPLLRLYSKPLLLCCIRCGWETSLTGRLIWGGEALIQSDNINNICFRGRNTDTHCWWRRWWRWDVKLIWNWPSIDSYYELFFSKKNIARGTTDPGYWVHNSNHPQYNGK